MKSAHQMPSSYADDCSLFLQDTCCSSQNAWRQCRQSVSLEDPTCHNKGKYLKQLPGIIPEAVSGESSVKLEEAFFPEGLHSTVHRALVWVAAIWQLLHLLNASLDKVKGQTACCCTESSNHGTTQNHSLAILGKASLLKKLLGLCQQKRRFGWLYMTH